MFDPQPEPAAPLRPEKSKVEYQLGKDGRGLPPPLEVENEKYLVELTGDDDPANAKSWPFRRKLRTALVLGFDTYECPAPPKPTPIILYYTLVMNNG